MEEHEFREKLTPEQYRVMREQGTETPHTGKYWDSDEHGIYCCAACGAVLFLSLNKKESEKGWPLFSRPAGKRSVLLSEGGERTEVACKKCGSHLGYLVGADKKEYEVNSIALDFHEMPDIDLDSESDNSNDQTQGQQSSAARNVSLTLGGLTIGAALGAGAMWYTAPTPMCMLNPTAVAATTAQQVVPATKASGASAPKGDAATTTQNSTSTSSATSSAQGAPAGTSAATATTTP
ncbi:MAG TPA: peptide-methionine (R)-S-oxide reductase [Candidatus Paceibacterota bacterium]|nr:peptide-methionine (R)-S-oxide reductase [Candidatus Paceibacterota bacterium]